MVDACGAASLVKGAEDLITSVTFGAPARSALQRRRVADAPAEDVCGLRGSLRAPCKGGVWISLLGWAGWVGWAAAKEETIRTLMT